MKSAFIDGAPGDSRALADGTSVNLPDSRPSLGDPDWQLFAYGPLRASGNLPSSAYIVVWATARSVRRKGMVVLRADALGPSGARRAVQATVSRSGVLSWKEVR